MAFGFLSPTFMGHKMQVMNECYFEEYSGFKNLLFKILQERTALKVSKLD